jgi:hypothetical protein
MKLADVTQLRMHLLLILHWQNSLLSPFFGSAIHAVLVSSEFHASIPSHDLTFYSKMEATVSSETLVLIYCTYSVSSHKTII